MQVSRLSANARKGDGVFGVLFFWGFTMQNASVENVQAGEFWEVVAIYNNSKTISIIDQSRDQALLVMQPTEAIALAKMLIQAATEARDELVAAMGF